MESKTIEGYLRRQIKLRAQLTALKNGKLPPGMKTPGLDKVAAIRRTQRQLSDLERAIAKCREKR